MGAERCKANAAEEIASRISCNITTKTKQDTLDYAVNLLAAVMTRHGEADLDTVTSLNPYTLALVDYFLDGIRSGHSKKSLQEFAKSWANSVSNNITREGNC